MVAYIGLNWIVKFVRTDRAETLTSTTTNEEINTKNNTIFYSWCAFCNENNNNF